MPTRRRESRLPATHLARCGSAGYRFTTSP